MAQGLHVGSLENGRLNVGIETAIISGMQAATAFPKRLTLAIAVGLSRISFVTAIAFGQNSQTIPTFQVADVHASAPANLPMQGGVSAGRFEIRRATMLVPPVSPERPI